MANKVLSPDSCDPFGRHLIDSIESPAPPLPDSSLLTANDDNNDFLSDLSDVEDSEDKSNQIINSYIDINNTINGSQRRRSSAFQMELLSG